LNGSAQRRLYDGPTDDAFALTVLGRHQLQYLRRTSCGSLQTEPPHWLDKAFQRGSQP
jgi:hypothetical protein